MKKITQFKENRPDLYEFIMFNVMSNVATATNFLVLWFGTGFLFSSLTDRPLHWFVFNYSTYEGGLGGFLSFLLAYVCAQIVNFIVQRKIVFKSNSSLGGALPWYVGTVVVAGLISIWLPPYIINLMRPVLGGFAPTFANMVNIAIQVLINYPMMKFKVMKKVKA